MPIFTQPPPPPPPPAVPTPAAAPIINIKIDNSSYRHRQKRDLSHEEIERYKEEVNSRPLTKGARKRFKQRIINGRETNAGQALNRDQHHTTRSQNPNRGREQNLYRNREPQSNRGHNSNQK